VAGSLLMPGILSQLLEGEAAAAVDPLAVKPPHFPDHLSVYDWGRVACRHV
jgi:hypothetical protein